MAKQLQLRKGTAAEHSTFTGANGEVTVDTTNKTLRVHDGTTVGGTQLVTFTSATTSTQGIVKLNDTLTSTSTTEALTAAQGKVLKDSLNTAITSSLGVGQTWQNVIGSRASGVNYTNTTGKPIFVAVNIYDGTTFVDDIQLRVRGTDFEGDWSFIVPNGAIYRCTGTIRSWVELR